MLSMIYFESRLVFVPTGLMTFCKFCRNLLYSQTFRSQQNNKMIEHVGAFVYESVIIAAYSFYNGFESFFSNFLCHAVCSDFSGISSCRLLMKSWSSERKSRGFRLFSSPQQVSVPVWQVGP